MGENSQSVIEEINSNRVFLSYSHDTPKHKDAVRSLCNRLRQHGVESFLDQYFPFPTEGWPKWMENSITTSKYVLIVCSEAYYRRASGIEENGKGLGAIWESQIITQDLFEKGGKNNKFVPILLSEVDLGFRPKFILPYTYFDVSKNDGFVSLLRLLTNQPEHLPPSAWSASRSF